METATSYCVTIAGLDPVTCPAAQVEEVCKSLTKGHPQPATLRVTPIKGEPVGICKSVQAQTESEQLVEDKARSERDALASTLAGFTVARPVYARGTRVNETGIENARQSRLDHESKPTVADYCHEFERAIRAEQRDDLHLSPQAIRMSANGMLVRESDKQRIAYLNDRGFTGFLSRTGIGGRDYLTRVPPMLRARNINNWLGGVDGLAVPTDELKLRTRNAGQTREVFAVTSKTYAPFDVDKIAEALRIASPEDARGTVIYDGQKARFEVMFHSNIQPERYVAGEFFKAGVVVETDDTGGGGIHVSACVWQNLCLNLIIIDQAEQRTSIRHVGSVERLAEKFQEAFAEALGRIEYFQTAWRDACDENVFAPLGTEDEFLTTIPAREALERMFATTVERELVPVRGKSVDVAKQLMRMFDQDDSGATRGSAAVALSERNVSRAAIVNAFTRYAHEVATPWEGSEIERAAGQLLYSDEALSV